MRFALLAAVVLCSCAAPASWRPAELASIATLSFQPTTGSHPTEDVAMGIDGAMLLPSPDGGPPIEVPHQRRASSLPRLQAAPPIDPHSPLDTAPGLGSQLWERQYSPAPFHSGVQLYRSGHVKLLIGTRTMIDERYPDSVTSDPRHDPLDAETAAVFGLRLRF